MNRGHPKPKDARSVALAVLTRLDESDAFIQQALDAESRRARLDRRDERLAWELTLGVERWRRRLDDALEQRIKRGFKKLEPMVLRILRLGVYQLLFLDRIPDRAAINTSAELGRIMVGEWAVSFINGVLRAIQRHGYTPPESLSPEKMSISYSHPQWLVERYYQRLGPEGALALCQANNTPAILTVRAATQNPDRWSLMESLIEEGARVSNTPRSDHGIYIEYHPDPFNSPSFKDKQWTVQDEASQLVVELLDPQPKERVWDVCAAPGGKTRYIAQRMNDQGFILATDVDESKVESLIESVPEQSVFVRQHDATAKLADDELFDRVLVDAPCSAMGLVRRHPEIRWRRRAKDVEAAARNQRLILAASAKMVKPGGVLVYSVCSDMREEGSSQIRDFLDDHRDFRLDPPDASTEKWADCLIDGEIHLAPHPSLTDGFYMARLKREES